MPAEAQTKRRVMIRPSFGRRPKRNPESPQGLCHGKLCVERSAWQPRRDAFEKAIARLEQDLRASIGGK
jgi:hypothetical protein